jgi:hypothetical protein
MIVAESAIVSARMPPSEHNAHLYAITYDAVFSTTPWISGLAVAFFSPLCWRGAQTEVAAKRNSRKPVASGLLADDVDMRWASETLDAIPRQKVQLGTKNKDGRP